MMDDQKAQALAPTRTRRKPSNQSHNAKWTPEENESLTKLVAEHGQQNWPELTRHFPGKTQQQISERWEKVLNPVLVKGSWTREEDELIISFVAENGTRDWTKLAALLPGRIGKQCRERWRNHLDPDVNREPWSEKEDTILIDMYDKIGSKWVKIAEHLPGRSDNAIKNRWNSTLKKRLEYERSGLERPKRGRPGKNATQKPQIPLPAKPKSADDAPKPPNFDEIAAIIRGQDSPFDFSALTPDLNIPYSPFSLAIRSPGQISDLGKFPNLWSPSQSLLDFGPLKSPNLSFSPPGPLKDVKDLEGELPFTLPYPNSPNSKE
jgi:hypothetical protein